MAHQELHPASGATDRLVSSALLPRKPTGLAYRPDLDAIRFVAFSMVFLFHVSYLRPVNGPFYSVLRNMGAFGMSLFFVLSSYLITSLLMKERTQTGSVNIPFFYFRRILRIWPLYFAFLFCMFAVGHFYRPWHFDLGTLASFLLLFGNWRLILHGVGGPVMPLWSISLEEQFYLIWPGLFRATRRHTFTVAIAIVFVLSSASIFWLSANRHTPWYAIWWNTLPQLQFFALGSLLALYSDRFYPNSPTMRQRLACCVAALLLFAAGAFTLESSGWLLVASYLFAGAACLLLLMAFWNAKRIPRVWTYLGKISYGLYVFHQLCLNTISVLDGRYHLAWHRWQIGVAALPLTIAFASLSYPLLEKPFLRLKRRFEVIPTR